MTRGGQRQGAGRKNSWASGCRFEETKLIRVPIAIADRVLDFAHRLDADSLQSVSSDLETKSKAHFAKQLEIPTLLADVPFVNQGLLVKRLDVSAERIRKSKGKTGDKALQSWSLHYDPDGIAWKYDSKTKKYTPAADLTPTQSYRLSEWLESILKLRVDFPS